MAITRPPEELVSAWLPGTQVWSVCGMNTIQPRSNPSIAHCRSKPASIACSAARVFSAWCEAAYCSWDIALKCFKMRHNMTYPGHKNHMICDQWKSLVCEIKPSKSRQTILRQLTMDSRLVEMGWCKAIQTSLSFVISHLSVRHFYWVAAWMVALPRCRNMFAITAHYNWGESSLMEDEWEQWLGMLPIYLHESQNSRCS